MKTDRQTDGRTEMTAHNVFLIAFMQTCKNSLKFQWLICIRFAPFKSHDAEMLRDMLVTTSTIESITIGKE